MSQDNRSHALKSLGVHTWRGAAMFGLQVAPLFILFSVMMKIAGDIFGIESIVNLSWWRVLLAPIASAFGLFVAVAAYAELQKLTNKDFSK